MISKLAHHLTYKQTASQMRNDESTIGVRRTINKGGCRAEDSREKSLPIRCDGILSCFTAGENKETEKLFFLTFIQSYLDTK
jgi:hypothetical protein